MGIKLLVRFAHNWNNGMMEYWVHSCSIWLKNNTVHGINKPWIEKTLIQTLKLCVFDHYSMIPTFHHSMWAAQNQCR